MPVPERQRIEKTPHPGPLPKEREAPAMKPPTPVRFLSLALGLSMLASGCAHLNEPSDPDAQFRRLSDEFITTHYASRPIEAVGLGWHEFDGQFVVPTPEMLSAEIARFKRFDVAFAALPKDRLSSERKFDLSILQSAIAGQRWTLETSRFPFRNPMTYAGALDVSVYLKRDFKPLPERIQDISAILRYAPALFAAARQNLEPTLPKPFVETAIEMMLGTAAFLEKDVATAAATVTNTTIRAQFQSSSEAAVKEIRGFVSWLQKEKLPKADTSFALGAAAYAAMLRTELIDLPAEKILEVGLSELRAQQRRFAEAAAVIDPNRKPIEVYKSIQREHPTAASLIPDTRKDLEMIRQFVVDHHIVTIPSPVRARVEETLPPFRATSFASMDTPGPFEKKATDAYYYVTPVEPDWTPQQAEEWLTAFNYYTTDVVSIHEAYPGHYVQFLALNASRATDIEKIFNSYPFVEGWAHYTEQMMLEQGFGQPVPGAPAPSRDELVKGAKYRLAQSDEALLRLCRLCCSVKLHTQGMTVEEATRFFVENCYYEEKPARQEAVRGTFDPGYLYYTLGKLMILKLRRDWQQQEGTAYSLQRFNDEILRHGSPPIPLLRKLILKDAAQWPAVL
jgi:uncharacterized protein (DUF885 family)